MSLFIVLRIKGEGRDEGMEALLAKLVVLLGSLGEDEALAPACMEEQLKTREYLVNRFFNHFQRGWMS